MLYLSKTLIKILPWDPWLPRRCRRIWQDLAKTANMLVRGSTREGLFQFTVGLHEFFELLFDTLYEISRFQELVQDLQG